MGKPRHELMKEFADKINELYDLAGGLRDMASGKDKEIFNLTRGALYNLRDKAMDQYYNWKPSTDARKGGPSGLIISLALLAASCAPQIYNRTDGFKGDAQVTTIETGKCERANISLRMDSNSFGSKIPFELIINQDTTRADLTRISTYTYQGVSNGNKFEITLPGSWEKKH